MAATIIWETLPASSGMVMLRSSPDQMMIDCGLVLTSENGTAGASTAHLNALADWLAPLETMDLKVEHANRYAARFEGT